VDPAALRVVEGRLDLARLAAAGVPLADLQTQIQLTRNDLGDLENAWVPSQVEREFQRLDASLGVADDDLQTALLASRSLPELLGVTTPQRYLAVFTEGAETGKVLGWASVLVQQGQLVVEAVGRTTDLPDQGASLPTFLPGATVPASGRAMVGAVGPLLPPGAPFKGTVVLGPETVTALSQLVGPVPVDALGITVKPEEIQAALTTTPDVNARLAVSAAVLAALGRASLPGPQEAGSVLSAPAGSGDLLVWVDDVNGQELADRLGVDGL
jgi:hypothetical protein